MIMSARQSDIVIHESQFSQNLFVNKYKCQLSKSKVIHPGKDISFYPVAKKKTEHINIKYNINDTYILCITKFLPYKNIERLIDAFGELKMINTNLSLVIVGEIYSQEYYNEIIEKIEFMNLNKNITILGEIKRQDLLFLYSGCNFLVYTSLYESCGYILMEAMSCGAAICCSNTTAVPEACENAALYFNPYDKSDIAKKMQILINDDNIRKSLKRESLKRAGELPDYAQVTTQTVSIMKNVIIN